MKRALATMLASGALATAGACNPFDPCAGMMCGPCGPPLSLRVTAPDGGSVAGVTLSESAGSCAPEATVTRCSVNGHGPGTYELDVLAPGYQSSHVREEVEADTSGGCCSCGFREKTVDVTLTPL